MKRAEEAVFINLIRVSSIQYCYEVFEEAEQKRTHSFVKREETHFYLCRDLLMRKRSSFP